MDDDSLERLAGQFLPPTEPTVYLVGAAGVLTPAAVARALDGLWQQRLPSPPPGYRGGRAPFGARPVAVRPPDWTVEAGGWRLVIRAGAMAGLEACEP